MKGGKAKSGAKNDTKLSVKKTVKAVKDPNKPKRPPRAFFVFMEDFRKTYKESHPNNRSVANVGRAAGEKWKSMTPSDKAIYVEKAEKRKKEYEKILAAYNDKQASGAAEEAEEVESDKSKSEVNDEDDDDEEGSDEEDEE